MSGETAPAPCPSCGEPVVDQPSTCPHCGLTFLSVCSCGATWHLLHPRCPQCGRQHRIRRRGGRRFWRSRRFRIGAFVGALAVLLLVNLFFVFSLSERRRKYHAYQDGLSAYERGNFEEATILFRQYLDLQPDSPEAKYMLGLSLIRTGDEEEAVARLLEATELPRGFPLANIALSEYYRRRGQIREAVVRARRATASEPAPLEAWTALGEALVEIGDADGAIEAFKRAVELDPDHVPSQLSLGDLYLTRQYFGLDKLGEGLALERYRRAEDTARRLLEADRTNVQARIWLAKARAGQGFLTDAIAELGRVVEEEPDDPEHRLLLARFYAALGDYEHEDQVLAKALVETPTPALAMERARILVRELRDPDEARRVLMAAIDRNRDHVGLRIALAAHYRNRGDLSQARRVLAEALDRFPGDAGVLEARGDLELASSDRAAAEERWREAIAANPEAVSVRKKIVRLLLPGVLDALGRGATAPPELEEVEAELRWFLDPESGLNPGDPDAREWAARLAFAKGDYDGAAALLGGGRSAAPGSFMGLRLLGISCLNREVPDYPRASQVLYQALTHEDCPRTFDDFDLAYTAAYRAGHHSRESEIAKMARERWPEDVEWRLRLATSLLREGKFDAAERECDAARVFLTGTDDVRAHLLMSRIRRAAGDRIGARQALEEAVLIRRDAETRGALYAFLAATGDEELAERGFQALVLDRPDDPEAFLRFGDFLLRRGRPEEALKQYDRARALAPGSREAIYRVAELRMSRAASDELRLTAAREAVAALKDVDAEDPYLDYFTGKLHLLQGENDEALSALRRYVSRNRNDPAGLYYLAIAYRRSGDLEKARERFLLATGLDPSMVEAKLELATLYFTQGIRAHQAREYESAIDEFGRALALDPNETETQRFMADTLAYVGEMAEAAAQAEHVIAAHPDDPGALFLAGVARARRRQFEEAEAHFVHLAQVAPENYRSHLYLGMVLSEESRFKEARESLRKAWQLAPEAEEVLHAVIVNELAGDNAPEALRILTAERERRPASPQVLHLLGNVNRALDRWEDAIDSWRAAFELDASDVDAALLTAAALADRGEAGRATEFLSRAASRATRPAPVLALRGAMLLAAGQTSVAEEALREALVADASYRPALRDLGLLLARTEREEEGRVLLERAVAAGLDHPGVWFRLARIARARGETDKAIERYRSALELVPDDPASLNNLALLLSERKDGREEAIRLAEQARSAAPDDARIADTLGWVLFRSEQFEKAAEVLVPAADRLPDIAAVQLHAGLAAFRSYRWDEARPLLRRAFDLGAEGEGVDAAKAALDRMR